MRYRQPIIKVVSIIMMFVLTQKVAGGLYLHNWLHTSKNTAALTHGEKAISQFNCSCIDDFYVPFTEPVEFSVEPPLLVPSDYFIITEQGLPVVSKHFSSLRGPPAA
jgi:hypothetical protein